MKQVQLIWAHPRADSLTARVAQAITEELQQRGWKVAELDLYRTGFNPVLQPVDEPDWADPDKAYSSEVMRLASDLAGKDAAFIVFPICGTRLRPLSKATSTASGTMASSTAVAADCRSIACAGSPWPASPKPRSPSAVWTRA